MSRRKELRSSENDWRSTDHRKNPSPPTPKRKKLGVGEVVMYVVIGIAIIVLLDATHPTECRGGGDVPLHCVD